jgi:opacity protein-like surface antigen
MKKFILGTACLLGGLMLHAQDVDFGVTAGYLNAEGKVKAEGLTFSANESGFYIGAVADFTLTDEFHIQPEVVYASIDEGDGILIPIMAKYYIVDKLNLQAGPQFAFSLEDTPEDISSVEFDLGVGVGYDITENFFAEARYSFQINNSYTGSEDLTARVNYLNIGLGYTF